MDQIKYLHIQIKETAKLIACETERIRDTLTCLACHTLELFDLTPRDDTAIGDWLHREGFAIGKDGFYLSLPKLEAFRNQALEPAAISYSWPPDRVEDSDARWRLYCHRNMGPMLMALHRRFEGVAWIYYQDVTNTALQYPYIDQIQAITPDFRWSDYHTYESVRPANNPERTIRWTQPNIDYAGQGLIVSASIPVYAEDTFIGLWSLDVTVDSLIPRSVFAPVWQSQLTCVVDHGGAVVSCSRDIPANGLGKGDVALVPYGSMHEAFSQTNLPDLFSAGSRHQEVTLDDSEYLLLWETVGGMNWLCMTVIAKNELLSSARQRFLKAFSSLGQGNGDAIIELGALPPELVEMGDAYNLMVADLEKTRKRLLDQQAALAQAKSRAESANRAKTSFLANMSHEIRTPLNGVQGMLQLLQTTPLNEEQNEYVLAAIQSSDRLTRLLSDILDISRIEASGMVLRSDSFDLIQTLEHSYGLFEVNAKQTGIRLTMRIDDNVPRQVVGDSMRLSQVINNLIGNAFKFTKAGEIHVEAYAIPCPSDCKSRILVSVTDTGIGIADDKIDLLFKPFSQISEGYRRDFQGAGLGLAICKQLVGLMGGSIAISSEPGQGTSAFFTVTFGNHERASEPQGLAAENVPHRLSPLRILLAEDDEVNRVSVSKLLESCGHSVVTVPDGSQALFTLTMDDFDVVLMDVQMPVMDGVEATKAIRRGEAGEDKADTKIIALTAYAMTGDKDTFLKAGMNDYLAKPVVLDELQSILSTHTHGAA